MKDSPYFKQAQLMLRVMPHVVAAECFALKGGTAINLYVRDVPRLSVDIDLTYLPLESRDTALANIGEALQRIAAAIRRTVSGVTVHEIRTRGTEHISKLTVSTVEATIKILMENEGITDEIRTAFVIYLASHDRPMNELLAPNLKDFRQVFEQEFARMTDEEVEHKELLAVRDRLIETIKNTMTEKEKKFLLSIKQGEPDWTLLPVVGIDQLPAIQWKLINIWKMDKKKQKESLQKLQVALGL